MGDEMVRIEGRPKQGDLLPPGMSGDASLLTETRARVVTSLDLSTMEGKRALALAFGEVDAGGKGTIGQTVLAEHFVLRDAQRRSFQSKELDPCKMLVLIGPDGETWSTTSDWAIQSFLLLASLRGPMPWSPPGRYVVTLVRTKGGFETYKLVESMEPAAKGGGRKGGPAS